MFGGCPQQLAAVHDVALIVADIVGSGAETNYRIRWTLAMSNECP